jgi:hypothetical protein
VTLLGFAACFAAGWVMAEQKYVNDARQRVGGRIGAWIGGMYVRWRHEGKP